jgi:small-conductance mechanosensitive channel
MQTIREQFDLLPDQTQDWLVAALAAGVAVVLALVIHRVLLKGLRKIVEQSESESDDVLVSNIARPSRYAMVALALVLVAREVPMLETVWDKIAGFVMPLIVGWMVLAVFRALIHAAEERGGGDLAFDIQARRRQTRLTIISRLVSAIIVFITLGLMLLSIPGVRDIGITLMASAGLAALAVGAAAQPALKSLIAGIQMVLTEPIRIGDMVKVDGHVGRVEETRMNFVLVRTWDERLIVVPTAQFFDESFENWSRGSEMLTGPVYLHLDPASEVDPIRAELERYVETNDLWDGRTAAMLMTEAYPESIELRIGVSAATIGDLWNLRCAVREHMVGWLRENQPDALIRHRLEVPRGHPKAGEL